MIPLLDDHAMSSRIDAIAGGITTALFFAVGNAIWALDMPEDGTRVAMILRFYDETADRIVVGGSLSLLSIGVLVFFAASLRQVLIEEGGNEGLATTAFGGALLCATAGIAAEGINLVAALRAQDGELTGELAHSLFEISQISGSAAAGLGFGVFTLAVGATTFRGGATFSRPFAGVLLAGGLALISPLAHVNWLAGAGLVLISVAIAASLVLRSADAQPAGEQAG